jgi:hypothetical protein
MANQRINPLDSATTREKAVKWSVSIPSIVKVLTGGIVKGLPGHRIRAGLQADGLAHLAPHLFAAQLGTGAEQPGVAEDSEARSDANADA